MTLGGASGGFSSNAILSDGSITIDGTNSKGAMTLERLLPQELHP